MHPMPCCAYLKRPLRLAISRAGLGAGLFCAALWVLTPCALSAQTKASPGAAYAITDLGPLANVADDVGLEIGDDGGVSLYVSDGMQVRAARWRDGNLLEIEQAPGYRNSIARATNGRGDLAGWSNTSANPVDSLSTTRAFVYIRKKLKMLGALGGRNSRAFGVSDAGAVVGVADVDAHSSHAFVWSGGALKDLGILPGGGFSAAYGVNGAGDAVGVADTAQFDKHAVAWRRGKIRDLGTLPGGTSSCALAVNTLGDAVGYAATHEGVHAFLYSEGRMRDLGTLKFDPSTASGINDRREIVGTSSVSAHARHAFLWRGGRMEDLNTKIAEDAGWTLVGGFSINNSGRIVCTGNRRGEPLHALLLTPISGQAGP